MMEIHYGYDNLNLRRPVVTMGIFDGVHRGHRMLLDRVVQEAATSEADSVAVTFDPHPRLVLSSDVSGLRFLTDIEERISLLQETGIGHLVIIPFTVELSRLTAEDFLKEVLCGKIGVRHLVAGFNHHFGSRHAGTSDTIMEHAAGMGFSVSREEALLVDGTPVSSSAIRLLLAEGKVEKASELLGYSYFLTGKVVSGRKIGRNLGFPTANIEPLFRYKLIPRHGVYAVEVAVEGSSGSRIAMLNIGTRPTIVTSSGQRTIEAHIIDFDGDLYGSTMKITFRHRLRDEMTFSDIDALAGQLDKDRIKTINLLRG